MRWRIALSAGVALTLAALAIKGVALAGGEPDDDAPAYLAATAARLRATGFAVAIDRNLFLVATRGACRLKARPLPPMGTQRLAFERLGAAFGPTRYAWRSGWPAEPPHTVPLLLYYAQRELARIGVHTARPTIAMVAGGAACADVQAALFDVPIVMH